MHSLWLWSRLHGPQHQEGRPGISQSRSPQGTRGLWLFDLSAQHLWMSTRLTGQGGLNQALEETWPLLLQWDSGPGLLVTGWEMPRPLICRMQAVQVSS